MKIDGNDVQLMFSYSKWRDWLQATRKELQVEGFDVQFRCGPDDGHKPGMSLGLAGAHAIGLFETWVTGEADYHIVTPPSPQAKMVAHKFGLVLSDGTFEMTFAEFLAEFRRQNSN